MSDFKIIGNTAPIVGKEEFYTVNSVLPRFLPNQVLASGTKNIFEHPVKWEVYILENGRWRKTKENDKTGTKVSYTFLQKSLARKGIRILVRKGDEVARLDVKPQVAEQPKIQSIEFLDKMGNKPSQAFAYGQMLKARVHCLHMEKRIIYATLWEDDAVGAGHDKANAKNKMISLPGTVKDGVADIDFFLNPDFAKIADAIKAKGDASEGKTHEYYVTAEFLNKMTASSNTNVANPNDKKVADPKVVQKKQTPAKKKGPSKKQEKEGSGEGSIFDWWEEKVKVSPIIMPDLMEIKNSVAKIFTPDKEEDKKEDNKKGICESEARVRAFMRMLRKGEGTQDEKGYTTQYSGRQFSDMSKHPETVITAGAYSSSAAGAYQIMRYTYWWLNGQKLTDNNTKAGVYEKRHDYIKKYKIQDFNSESQDKLCLIILKHKRPGCLELIIKNQIKKALNDYGSYEWASLPPGRYGQPTQTMIGALDEYNRCLKEELSGKSNLHLKKGFLKEFGYDCCSESSSKEKAETACGKSTIELTDKVKWQTQFDSKWGDYKKQSSACKKTCDDILIKQGLKATSLSNIYQTAIETDNHTKLTVNVEISKNGVAYLDSQLEKGNPVQVGVDHDLNYKITNNADGSTDHFIVIVGRGCEKNKPYYLFYDVGTSHKEKGASENNKLYLDTTDYSLKGKTVYNGNFYTVTQIRKN